MDIDLRCSSDGDWEAIYVNGKLMEEGHSLSAEQIIGALGYTVQSNKEYSKKQMDDIGWEFPKDLTEEPK